jgi:hypothetical protein
VKDKRQLSLEDRARNKIRKALIRESNLRGCKPSAFHYFDQIVHIVVFVQSDDLIFVRFIVLDHRDACLSRRDRVICFEGVVKRYYRYGIVS